MDTMAIIKLIVMQMFAILAVVFIIAFFLILKRTLRLQKKFLKYTIKPLKNDKVSFFDKIIHFALFRGPENCNFLQ